MKQTHLKIWPEIINYQPAIIPFDKTNDQKENSVHIDFSNCGKVDSSGLTLLIVDLIKVFKKRTKRKWSLSFQNTNIKESLVNLGFFNILNPYSGEYELRFDNHQYDETLINENTKCIKNNTGELEIISYPIYNIDFKLLSERRDVLEDLRKCVSDRVKQLFIEFGLKTHFFLAIIQEMAKNSADHTSDNAFLGLDIITNEKRTYLKIQFTYADLGIGIHNSIKEFILKNDLEYKSRVAKMALSDSYHYALKNGFTTKPDSFKNKGIGMTTILEASSALNLNLSVFDADSRSVLTHLIWSVGKIPVFIV